jgi:hypothetical protein
MRKPFRSQNRAVTAAFFIAPVVPGVSIPQLEDQGIVLGQL